MMKFKPFVIALPIALLLFLCIVAYFHNRGIQQTRSRALQEEIASQLQVGMTQREVDDIVSGKAWERYTCTHASGPTDIYLFGVRDHDLAGILMLQYLNVEDTESLQSIATVDNSMLDNLIYYCEKKLPP